MAKDMDNLLVGGRSISVDVAVHSSARVKPAAVTVGQAAVMTASMVIKAGKDSYELDGKEVRAKLVEYGVYRM